MISAWRLYWVHAPAPITRQLCGQTWTWPWSRKISVRILSGPKGPGHDPWERGRFLEEWADPRAVRELPSAFAHYNEEDIWRALAVTMDLFHRISLETEKQPGYAYPTGGADFANELVIRLSQGAEL